MTVDWRKVAGRMRSELDRAALNERPRLVLAVLIRVTLMRGSTVVILPDREVLCGLLGIGKQHMAGVWREIEGARIAAFKKVTDGWECVVNADSSRWAVEWAWSRESWTRFAEMIERVPGQSQESLLPPDPSLTRTMAECSAEAVSSHFGNSKPPEVPKMGTERAPVGTATPFNALKVQSSKPCTRLSNFEPLSEAGLMERCMELFGEQIMAAYGGNWRIRARQNPGKLDRVLNDTVAAQKERRIKTIPAAYANDAWGRFK